MLTLVDERLDTLAAMPSVAGNVESGWEMILEKQAATNGAAR